MRSDAISKLSRALVTLRRFVEMPVEDDRDAAGVIQAFEFCYELAWKSAVQATLASGYSAKAPRPALANAFQMGLIAPEDADTWAEMAETRNLTVHTYSDEWALTMVEPIRGRYLPALERFASAIRPFAERDDPN